MEYSQILADYNDILLPEDVQKILHTGRNTVYQYLAQGKIRSLRIGGKYKIPKLYLLEFIYPDKDFSTESEKLWQDLKKTGEGRPVYRERKAIYISSSLSLSSRTVSGKLKSDGLPQVLRTRQIMLKKLLLPGRRC